MRKPTHPGILLEEHYIKPLRPQLEKLAENLEISRDVLSHIRKGEANITPRVALRLAKAFDTSPEMWLNLQQKYDLWLEAQKKPALKTKKTFKTFDQDVVLKREFIRYSGSVLQNLYKLAQT